MFRLAEVSLGLVASVLGVFGLGVALFEAILRHEAMFSLISGVIPDTEQWIPSFARLGLSGVTIVFLVMTFLAAIGVGVGAYLHAERKVRASLVLLWGCTVVFSVGVVICDLSIALYIYEVVPIALVACIIGTVREIQGPDRETD